MFRTEMIVIIKWSGRGLLFPLKCVDDIAPNQSKQMANADVGHSVSIVLLIWLFFFVLVKRCIRLEIKGKTF